MALLPFTQLETHPVGTANTNGLISGNWLILEAIAAENGFHRAALNVITYAASVTVPFDAARHQYIDLTGNITIAFGTLTAGADVTLMMKSDGSSRNLTWPGSVRWLGAAAPSALAANKTIAVRFFSVGTTAADVVATWSVQL